MDNHINLLDDRLKEICEKLEDLFKFHNLPFKRFETLRTPERQAELIKLGYTHTLNSKHLPNKIGKSEACDYVLFIDGKYTWDNKLKFYYDFMGGLVLSKWGDKVNWGGAFKSFYDGPHIELK